VPRDESGHSPPLQFHRGPNRTWSDERLIRGCLNGDDRAWSALLEKYRNLIYSIPMKYGASREDAADIFQAVSLELFSELPRLRKQSAFRSWLITITAHASLKWKRKQQRRPEDELTAENVETLETEPSADLIEEVEREQALREALAQLSPRCQELITMLFYREPPLPYREVAQTLGLATGSIGFIRGRCLKRLERLLAGRGFWM
jgi:RNA polymerase sigma factor (sigma-70 family)